MNIIHSVIINNSTFFIDTLHSCWGKMKKLIVVFYPFILLITFILTSTSIYADNVSDSTGSISGMIAYSGSQTGTVYVGAFTSLLSCSPPNSGGPVYNVDMSSPGSYTLPGLPDGTYYIASVIATCGTDCDIEFTDPWGVYGDCDTSTPVTISGGNDVSGRDITLVDGTDTNPNPFYEPYEPYPSSAISGHWLNQNLEDVYALRISVDDTGQDATSVSVTGTGISGSLSLSYDSHWQSWTGIVTLSTGTPPSFPLTYTITIIDPFMGTITKTETVNAYVAEFASNLSPSGGEAVTGTPVFSWIVSGQYDKYGVFVLEDPSGAGGYIWTKFVTTLTVTYDGLPLTPGIRYDYQVLIFDWEGNYSEVSESFVYQGDSTSPFHPHDNNPGDWVIGDFELLNAIDDWATGNLGDFELLDLIDFWAAGCYEWDTLNNQYKSGCSNGSGYYEIYGAQAGDYTLSKTGHQLIGTSNSGNSFNVSGYSRFILYVPPTSSMILFDAIGLDAGWVNSQAGAEYGHYTNNMNPTGSSWAQGDSCIEGSADEITMENTVGSNSYYGFTTNGASILTVYIKP